MCFYRRSPSEREDIRPYRESEKSKSHDHRQPYRNGHDSRRYNGYDREGYNGHDNRDSYEYSEDHNGGGYSGRSNNDKENYAQQYSIEKF